MARYIDADKVMEEIVRIGGHNLCGWDTIGVKALIDRQPTADVVPRAEVAREIFEEIETSLQIMSFHGSEVYYAIRAEDYLHYKKKYTEGEK